MYSEYGTDLHMTLTLLCSRSPDGRYLVLGGEDDLVTVYSFHERRVVVRGQGHKSWVSMVSFDVYNIAYDALPDGLDFSGSDDESQSGGGPGAINSPSTAHRAPLGEQGAGGGGPTLHTHAGGITRQSVRGAQGNRGAPVVTEVAASGACSDQDNGVTSPLGPELHGHPAASNTGAGAVTCYRFGSVGQDTLICLWDLTEDVLKRSGAHQRSRGASQGGRAGGSMSNSNSVTSKVSLSACYHQIITSSSLRTAAWPQQIRVAATTAQAPPVQAAQTRAR